MSRKILKIGSDVLTLNDKLVSVTEDYPFWKVNGALNSQYYNKLLTDFKLQAPVLSDAITWTSSLGSCMGACLAPNGFVYGIPASSSTIPKYNPNTNTTTYIGSLGANTLKFSGHQLVGDIIYMFPRNSTYILKLDTRTDFITFIGTFTASTAGAFSTPTMAEDGKIYCLGFSAAQVLEFNPTNDSITLHSTPGETNIGCAVAGNNGFIYGAPAVITTGTFPFKKFNITTKTYSVISGGNFGISHAWRGINVNGIIFFSSTSGAGSGTLSFIDTATDTLNRGALVLSGSISFWTGLTQGADGWLYLNGGDTITASFRINPYNLSIEQVEVAQSATGHRGYGALLPDGRILFPGFTATAQVRTFKTTTLADPQLPENRILSRYQN